MSGYKDAPRAAAPRMPRGFQPADGPLVPPAKPSSERLKLIQGENVDYFSKSLDGWIPAIIRTVDHENGTVTVCRRATAITLDETRECLRARTKPPLARLEWMRLTMRDGGMMSVAKLLWDRYSDKWSGGAVLNEVKILGLCVELDAMLGVAGEAYMGYVSGLSRVMKDGGGCVNYDDYLASFWELVHHVQKRYGNALNGALCMKMSEHHPKKYYDQKERLGQGGFGYVDLMVCKTTGVKRAVKALEDNGRRDTEAVMREIGYLCTLDHPHIVKIYEYYNYIGDIFLVMDYCCGGDLAAAIARHEETREFGKEFLPIEEGWIATVTAQVLSGIAHVHARGVLHLDLKPENIMLMPQKNTVPPAKDPSGRTLVQAKGRPYVMIIDLGVAQLFNPGDYERKTPLGTPATMAPETWSGVQTPKADVWSIGVILYLMLTLNLPFEVPWDMSEVPAYWKQQPTPEPDWWWVSEKRSKEATNMCRRMMAFDRTARAPAADCMGYSFVRKPNQILSQFQVPPDYVERLKKFPNRSILHKSVAYSIAGLWPANQLPTIRRIFHVFDIGGDGVISAPELARALHDKCNIDTTTAGDIARAMDLNGDGKVEWSDFVAACIHLGSDSLERDLLRVFQDADVDQDGFIVQDDIRNMLPSEAMRGKEASKDAFGELTNGRTGKEEKVDWRTFRRHFKTVDIAEMDRQDRADPQPKQHRQPYQSSPRRDQVSTPRGAYVHQSYQSSPRRGEVSTPRGAYVPTAAHREKCLQDLVDMGFYDRDKNSAALRKCQWDVQEALTEVLGSGYY